MRAMKLLAGVSALCAAAACASTEDIRAMRRPVLPPTYVALADHGSPLHRNVAIYEIDGAPEFRLFDAGHVITTRPTRAEVAAMLRHWLGDADMLAESIGEADYLLSVSFEDLRGPDVIPFSDKSARAVVRYTLQRRGCRQQRQPDCTRFEGRYEAQLQARMPGVTPEMVRAAIGAGLIGAALGPGIAGANDPTAAAAFAGGELGGASAVFASGHDTVLWDWPEAVLDDMGPRFLEGFGLGLVLGGGAGAEAGPGDSDPAARWHGGIAGAAIGLLAAAPAGRRADHWDSQTAPGAFDGTRRRQQAVSGMMRQNFNRFLFGLRDAELLAVREAVPCADLNPRRYNVGIITATHDAVGYDCPIGRTWPVNEGRPAPPRRF